MLICASAIEKFLGQMHHIIRMHWSLSQPFKPLQKDWKAASFVFLFALALFVLQVNELSSQLDTKQQEVISLQRSFTAAQEENNNLEQTLTSLVRVQDAFLALSLWLNTLKSLVW